jgi:hypothetical protein
MGEKNAADLSLTGCKFFVPGGFGTVDAMEQSRGIRAGGRRRSGQRILQIDKDAARAPYSWRALDLERAQRGMFKS